MNERRSLLIVSYYFPPMGGAGALRLRHLSNGLAARGWETTVVTVKDVAHPYRDPELLGKLPEKIHILRAESHDPLRLFRRVGRPAPSSGPGSAASLTDVGRDILRKIGNVVCFPDTRRGWIRPALAEAVRTASHRPPSLILSSSPPASAHVVGFRLAERTGIPWVADFRDPLSLFLYPSLYPTRFHRRRIAALEQRILERADAMIANTPGLADHFARRVPDRANRLTTITNGFDPAAFQTPQEPPKRFVVLHTGSLGAERHLGTFLEGLSSAINQSPPLAADLELRLVGDVRRGVRRQLHQFLRRMGQENLVRFDPPASYARAAGEMVRAALLLLIHHPGPGSEISVPCKLYDYIGSGRPILAVCPPGDARRLVERYPLGLVADFDETSEIAERLLQAHRDFRAHPPPRIREHPLLDEYTWDRKADQLDRLLTGLIAR